MASGKSRRSGWRRKLERKLTDWLAPTIVGGLASLLRRTWRVTYVGREQASLRPVIGAVRHSDLFTMVADVPHVPKDVHVMVSQSRDGGWATRLLERRGGHAVRGSSSKGGVGAFRELERLLENRQAVLMVVDGPRGPAGKSKPGVAKLSERTGIIVVPVAAEANRAWRLPTWDKALIPKPFARVVIAYGEGITCPAGADKAAESAFLEELDVLLTELRESALELAIKP